MVGRALSIGLVIVAIAVAGCLLCFAVASDGQVSILLGELNIESGLYLDSGGDVDTEVVRGAGVISSGRRTGNGTVLPEQTHTKDRHPDV